MPSSIITNPGTYSPVNKEIWFQTDDSLSAGLNFKYVYKINKLNPLTDAPTSLGVYKVPPRPSTGYGLFTPHKVLRSQVSYNLQPYIQWITNANNSAVKYNLNYGFQYSIERPYTGTFNASGNLALTLSTTSSNPFLAGDIIYIDKTNKQSNPQYDGEATITSSVFQVIFGITVSYIVVNKDFVTSSTSDAGVISDLYRIEGTSSNFWAFNGTRQYTEINTNFSDDYVFRDSAAYTHFLTEYGIDTALFSPPSVAYMEQNGKPIYNYQFETLSVFQEGTFPNMQYSFGAYTATGSLITTWSIQATSSTNILNRRFDLPVGTANLTLRGLVGTTSNIKYYLMNVYDSSYNTKASKIWKVVNNCSPYPNNYRLAFLNRLGGFDYYNFNWKSTNTINKTSVEFKKILDYNYSIGDRQDTILSQDANNSYTISTDWITEKEAEWFKQLITSPEVYQVSDPWEFFDNSFNAYSALGFVGKTKHKFKVGDQITIKQFPGFTHASYNNTFTITQVPDEYNIITDGAFVSTTGAEGGLAYYADNRFLPLIITDTSYTVKTKINDKLFAFSLTFRYAYQVNLQNQ